MYGCGVDRSSLDDRTGTLSSVEPVFSGLYAYHVATSTWSRLRADAYHPGPGQIRSRVSHCMLLDHVSYPPDHPGVLHEAAARHA